MTDSMVGDGKSLLSPGDGIWVVPGGPARVGQHADKVL